MTTLRWSRWFAAVSSTSKFSTDVTRPTSDRLMSARLLNYKDNRAANSVSALKLQPCDTYRLLESSANELLLLRRPDLSRIDNCSLHRFGASWYIARRKPIRR